MNVVKYRSVWKSVWIINLVCVGLMVAHSAEIISPARRVQWENNVGVSGGIPDSSRMVVNQTLGTSATMANIQSALVSCPSNRVVQLAAGVFNVGGDLDWQGVGDGVVLRGSTNANGTPATIIRSSSSLCNMRLTISEAALSTEANLAADGVKGGTTITLSSVPAWVVPDVVIGIDQLDDPTLSTNQGQEGGQSYREIMGNGARGMAQLLRVVSKTSTTITFDTPLAWTFATSRTAQIFQPFGTKLRQRCGIENVIWEHTGAASSDNHMFKLECCRDSWLKNVYGTNLVGGIYVFGVGSYRCEVRQCRFDNSKALGGGQGYGIGLYHFNTQWLIEDNIFRKLHVGMQNNYGSCYNVFAYNFETDGQSDSGQNPGMSGHGTTGYMTLFEGNWCMDKFLGDYTHGAGCYYTVFRNRIDGKNPAQSMDQTVISNERYNRKVNIVGNLLGHPGYHTVYMVAPSGGGYAGSQTSCSDSAIYKMGFWANIGCDAPEMDSYSAMDPVIAVNYDVVTSTNNGVVLGGFQTSDLVNSYFLAGKPLYFGSLNWPPYSPSMTSLAALDRTNIPAGYRYVYGVDPPKGGASLPPIVSTSASPTSGPAPLTVNFSSAGSFDPEGVAVSYSWTFGDGAVSTAANPVHTYSSSGVYTARLTVSDGVNSTSSSNIMINVTLTGTNQPPIAVATANPVSGTPPLTVSFSSSGSYDPEGGALTYTWTFGDGATSAAANPSHAYSGMGSYSALLRVSDGTNATSSSVMTITVTNPLPTIGLTSPVNGTSFNAPATISCAANVVANGHSITRVEFYGGSALLGQDSGAPYTLLWTNVGVGSYTLTAQVVYDSGARVTSAPVSISVGGLVAAFGFDEGSGTRVGDSSGNGNGGTITGASWSSAGRFGKALVFGQGSLVTIPDSLSLKMTGGITLEAWVKPTALNASWMNLIFKPNGDPSTQNPCYVLHGSKPSSTAPSVYFTGAASNLDAPSPLSLNAWSHLATTYDGTMARLYVNGVQVASQAQSGTLITSTDALTIGGNAFNGENWTGLIDEVRVYSRALSQVELQSDMDAPVVVTSVPPDPPTGLRVVASP